MALDHAKAGSGLPFAHEIEPIDVDQELEAFTLEPRPPDMSKLDPQQILFSFDRRSDTLMVYFFGRGRDVVGVECGNNWYWLVDSTTEEVIGMRIESFLSRVVPAKPFLVNLLDVAELRGITAADVRELRKQHLPWKARIADGLLHRHQAPTRQKQRLTERMEEFVCA